MNEDENKKNDTKKKIKDLIEDVDIEEIEQNENIKEENKNQNGLNDSKKNEKVEEFNITFLLPNIQVLKCVFKMKLVNFWQLIGLILFLALLRKLRFSQNCSYRVISHHYYLV